MFAKIRRIHFVGIGGIGMSGIAEVLLSLGYEVSGSDQKLSPVTDRLRKLGAAIAEGHNARNIAGAEVVVTTSAVGADNAEVVAARQLRVPIIQRAEMLAELMRLKHGIAIAGMHGKTTTTSMVAAVLAAGGLDPTVVVGGRIDALGSNARTGTSEYMVAEADESDRSFLKLSPILCVVTNIDREHMDCYRDMEAVEDAFVEFIDRIPFYGTAVLCNDDDRLRELLPRIRRRVVTYGTRAGSDFHIESSQSFPRSRPDAVGCISEFSVEHRGFGLGKFRLQVPGVHNLLNATAAIAVGVGLDISGDHIRAGLESFRGVDRRLQLVGSARGVSVIDDYGHHPTEIRATLAAARTCGPGKIHVIFQPHRYTRTQDLLEEFVGAFTQAESLQVLDVYAASEKPIEGISGWLLAERIKKSGHVSARYASSFDAAVARVVAAAQPGDMILTLGAGSVVQVGAMVLHELAVSEMVERWTDSPQE